MAEYPKLLFVYFSNIADYIYKIKFSLGGSRREEIENRKHFMTEIYIMFLPIILYVIHFFRSPFFWRRGGGEWRLFSYTYFMILKIRIVFVLLYALCFVFLVSRIKN